MGSIGTPEILLVLAIALLLFGPKKLPEFAKSLGRAVADFKKASSEIRQTIEKEVEDLEQTDGAQSSDDSADAGAGESSEGQSSAGRNNGASPVESGSKPARKS